MMLLCIVFLFIKNQFLKFVLLEIVQQILPVRAAQNIGVHKLNLDDVGRNVSKPARYLIFLLS